MNLFSTAQKMGLSLTHVKLEAIEPKAAAADPKIDLRGLEDLLFGTMM